MSDQPTPLPPERRAEIERREKAATLGPWEACKTDLRCLIEAGVYSNGIRIAGMIAPLRKLEQYRDANAEFIAHARTDIPDLLREVKRQAGEIAQRKFAADRQADEILELRGKVNHLQSRLEMAGRVAELEAEVDNLKAQICALKFEREMGGRHV